MEMCHHGVPIDTDSFGDDVDLHAARSQVDQLVDIRS
jgi:hypothetical protein